jgi:hypothetical protein
LRNIGRLLGVNHEGLTPKVDNTSKVDVMSLRSEHHIPFF